MPVYVYVIAAIAIVLCVWLFVIALAQAASGDTPLPPARAVPPPPPPMTVTEHRAGIDLADMDATYADLVGALRLSVKHDVLPTLADVVEHATPVAGDRPARAITLHGRKASYRLTLVQTNLEPF